MKPAIVIRMVCTRRTAQSALLAAMLLALGTMAWAKPPSTWPQAYSVTMDKPNGTLTLETPYYAFEHDLKRGGVIQRITLRHGKATNLLVRPVETRVQDEKGAVLSDLKNSAPKVNHERKGLNTVVTVECALADEAGRPSAVQAKTTYEYRWGYVKIRKEISVPAGGFRAREVSPFSTVLAPSLAEYGYREGQTEEDGAPPFSFGSNRWRKLRRGEAGDKPLETRFIPRSMIFADPGVEGLEWFVGSDLAQWDLQLSGKRGQGRCSVTLHDNPPGLALAIAPLWATNASITLTNACVLNYYVGVPLLEGHAWEPWLHTSFNRNKGNWVSAEEIRGWAEKGYQTVHCHNDGDYYDDGLFWRDGSYPPYPDMEAYDKVLTTCRKEGIRTATYFSNKELHPSTGEFQKEGLAWARMNRKGDLQHNYFRGKSEFGAQMCLRSGWRDFLKFSIDRVLDNHPLDGVYYDWNVALFCCNPRHEGKGSNAVAQGHWDMDEMLEFMEWTRERVGKKGLVIVHNTTTPMYVLENFADYIVATEWGYGKWTNRAPDLRDLPLEWSLVGARSRGVISYGTIDAKAPKRLHRVFALQALLGGVAPWPASPEMFELLPLLKPIGKFEKYRFADWRNQAVTLSDSRCGSAIYSRRGEAFVLLANLDEQPKEVTCVLRPDKLPHPLKRVKTALKLNPGGESTKLDAKQLAGPGLKLTLPGDALLVIQVR